MDSWVPVLFSFSFFPFVIILTLIFLLGIKVLPEKQVASHSLILCLHRSK